MARDNLNDIAAFVAVAEACSFTTAAKRLGVSQSALSHAMRGLEERLGVRLLARTTRSVSPTEAGARLLAIARPRLAEIDAELDQLAGLNDRPAGTIRISAPEHASVSILYPAAAQLMRDHPDINIEISVDNAFTDIVANRFDAGIRLGENLAKDMIAVRISPQMRLAIVGTPAYFAHHPEPVHPGDLVHHNCINMRKPTHGDLMLWEFEKEGQVLDVGVKGQFTHNSGRLGLAATIGGLGLGYGPEDMFAEHIVSGALVRVLEDWCEPFPGYYLYYPSRRQHSAAFALLVEALRYRGDD